MTDPAEPEQEPAPTTLPGVGAERAPAFPFDDVAIETETMPDGRHVHYYWCPAAATSPSRERPAQDV